MSTRGRDLDFLEVCAAKRIKHLQNKAIIAALIATQVAESTQGPQGPKRADEHPFSWEVHLSRLTAKMFTFRYRLTPAAFDILHSRVRNKLSAKDVRQAERSRGN
jgi:hypothetical protein